MKSSRWLWLAVVSVGTACNLYNKDLLDNARGDGGSSGGSDTGGEANDGDGGRSGGGAPAGGGNGPDGGTGGENMGGDPGGGGTGGDETGGTSGGGAPGGGGSGGTGGTGGSTGGVPSVTDLVDDLSSETLVYSNAPFFGTWTRYAQDTGVVWVPTSIDGMVADDDGNFALHVNATFTVDDWGVDVVLPLQESGGTYTFYDITEYSGVRFRAKRSDTGSTALKVSLEDEASHRGSTLCVGGTGGSGGYDGADCDNHAVAPSVGLTTTWKEFYVPLTSFTTGVSGARDEPLDATHVYAIHFQMNPSGTTPVDFWIDDIYLVTFD